MTRFRLIRRLLHKFVQVGKRRRALLAEAVFGLLAARLALAFVSFPRLARPLGTLVVPSDPRVSKATTAVNPGDMRIAEDVSWAVTRAARYVPFKVMCLPQAMAGHAMLRRRGVACVMHFGAATGQAKPFETHAWLSAAGVEVTGYPVAEWLAEIACFV
jgi:hypothetical protein